MSITRKASTLSNIISSATKLLHLAARMKNVQYANEAQRCIVATEYRRKGLVGSVAITSDTGDTK